MLEVTRSMAAPALVLCCALEERGHWRLAGRTAPINGEEEERTAMSTETTTADSARGEAGLDPNTVCTLSADGLEERLAWIRSEILPHAVASERRPDGIAWELEDAPGLAAKLDRLVALERECCSGIDFRHGTSLTAGRRRLEVRGIDPRATAFDTLQADADETRWIGGRLAKAAGLGALLSLLVCCVLPIAAAALLGAAAAAPFASLDDPWKIAGAMLLFGGAAFAWQGRRRALAPARDPTGAPCRPDC